MNRKKIERNILEKATQEYLESLKKDDESSLLVSKSERQAHFEKNYKKK